MDYERENENDVQREKPSLETTLGALREDDGQDATIYYGLSDLTDEEIQQFAKLWQTFDDDRRRSLMSQLVEVGESNFEFDYSPIAKLALHDPDAQVRQSAIEGLWESESVSTLAKLLEMAQWDDSQEVRAAALSAVGRFILMGELGEFSEAEALKAQDIVINILNDENEDVDVRRRALEAISNSSHEIVEGAIRDAYESHDRRMQISSVFAMGRSCDEQWNNLVMRELDSADPEMRYEAARAAGELMIEDAIAPLSRMVFEDDRELMDNAVWSLGEIGGKEAMRVLNLVAGNARETGDDDLLESVEDALASASLGGTDLYLMSFEDEDKDER